MSHDAPELSRPGANTLRSGGQPGSYSGKTLNSNWVEDRYVPGFSGTRKHASTEQLERTLSATGGRVPLYGTALKDGESKAYDECIDYKNVVTYDKTATDTAWESVTKSTFRGAASAPTEFSTSFKSMPHELNSNPSTTEEYRKRWIVGDKGAPERRFVTETAVAASASAAPKYRARQTRALPGVPKIVEVFRKKIAERGGSNGIRAIGRMFRVMDDSGNRRLSQEEFKFGLIDFGLEFTRDELVALWHHVDKDKSGTVDYDEFLRSVRGEMNERRVAMVAMAWEILDKTDDDKVTLADLEGTYDVSFHPDVVSGKCTPEEALTSFLGQWDTIEKDGVVTFAEFCEYYNNVSSSIDTDDYFELMMRNAWHIAGGEGVTANTANLRVLVEFEDGRKSVECVKNDLGLDKSDLAAVKARLTRQGLSGIVNVSTDF